MLAAGADLSATPLFGTAIGVPFTYEAMADVLKTFLSAGAGVPDNELSHYSVHSFRITLATLLYTAKVPVETIKRLLRWRSDDSVLIYGRLSDAESTTLVHRTLFTHADSRVAPRLAQQAQAVDINIHIGDAADPMAAIERAVDAAA